MGIGDWGLGIAQSPIPINNNYVTCAIIFIKILITFIIITIII